MLLDSPAAGDWNMAVDQVLMETAAEQDLTSLRFYQWSAATVSLGYFQHLAERDSHVESRPCPLVRRSTGGGAIVHDHELTYCFATPATSTSKTAQAELYRIFHETLVDCLATFGITASLHDGQCLTSARRPFLCFQCYADGDVLISGVKIAGSAQRRFQGAVMQHGSVLLRRSASAPQLDGIAELAGVSLDAETVRDTWLISLASRLNLEARSGVLDEPELSRAESVRQHKFADPKWTERR